LKSSLRANSTLVHAALAIALSCALSSLRAAGLAPLHTNQSYIEEVTAASDLRVSDPVAVFDFVLQSLPPRVRVYPTENYYYFSFHHRGLPYLGNIRLAARDRDEGKVHIAYYEDGPVSTNRVVRNAALDSSDGVRVERLEPLVYRVSRDRTSIIFELNDLADARPPNGMLLADEQFLGPVFDESGIRFFLVFNRRLRLFHYLLDETGNVPEEFVAGVTNRILIGKRTEFCVYRDHRRDRKILIGVNEANVRANNYFDGPFDQLPDNFIRENELRDAIIASDPRLAGRIDRYGHLDDENRHVIAPYALYSDVADLDGFDKCANRAAGTETYGRCFDIRFLMTDPPRPR